MKIAEVSLKALASVCSAVNRINIKSLNSYKLACKLLESLGYIYPDVEYENSYMIEDEYIDMYSYLNKNILIYSTNENIIGLKVKEAPYSVKKFLEMALSGYKIYQTCEYTVYER